MRLTAEFRSDVALVREFAQRTGVEPEHGLSSSKVTRIVASVDYQRLCDFAGRGNLVEVEITSGADFASRFRAEARPSFAADDPSAAIEALRGVVDADAEPDATKAIEIGRFDELAAMLPSSKITIALTLRQPEGHPAFLWSTDALFALTDSWVGLAHFLTVHPDLLLLDAGAVAITSPSLAIRGPDAQDLPPRKVATGLERPPWRLAPPHHFLATTTDIKKDATQITDAMTKLAVGVIWLRVSVSPPIVTPGHNFGTVQVAFSHDPTQLVNIGWEALPGDEEAVKAGELWKWLDADDDLAGRLEAVRQAAATSVRSERDVRDGVNTVLRQGRFLYELSRQRSVAAVVDARKAARLAAQSAAHSAAAEARSAARSTADRTVAAVVAALAVMVTHKTDVLSRSVSYLVLAAVLVGIVAALAQAIAFELPATESALKATLADLRLTQRNVLLDEDIVEFESGAVVEDARTTLNKAKVVVRLAGGCSVAAVVVGVLVVRNTPQEVAPPPPTSTAPTTTAPTTTTTNAGATSPNSASRATPAPSRTSAPSGTKAAPSSTSVAATAQATTSSP